MIKNVKFKIQASKKYFHIFDCDKNSHVELVYLPSYPFKALITVKLGC